MTVWGKLFRRRLLPTLKVDRIPTPDGYELTVASAGAGGTSPVLLLLHGLEGGPASHYVGGILRSAVDRGWQARLLVFRTCDGLTGTQRRTYHSGETTDLDLVIQSMVSREPGRPIGLVGISLGGNVLLKWMGEKNAGVPGQVRAAVAASVPYDLAACSRAIDRGFSRAYQWNFLRSLREKARAKRQQYPDLLSEDGIESIRTMWEFDDVFTAPLHGFRDAADYYERSSSLRYLRDVRRPTLLISAYDDPFHTPSVLHAVEDASAANPDLVTEFHRRGGHVGFVSGAPWNPEYYLDRRVAEFLAEHLLPMP